MFNYRTKAYIWLVQQFIALFYQQSPYPNIFFYISDRHASKFRSEKGSFVLCVDGPRTDTWGPSKCTLVTSLMVLLLYLHVESSDKYE